jgi:hypothetical protein
VAQARLPELVQVRETREILEAELIALKLREAGLDAQILDQTFRQEPLPNVRAFSVVRVMVPQEQEQAARRELERDATLPEDAEEVDAEEREK